MFARDITPPLMVKSQAKKSPVEPRRSHRLGMVPILANLKECLPELYNRLMRGPPTGALPGAEAPKRPKLGPHMEDLFKFDAQEKRKGGIRPHMRLEELVEEGFCTPKDSSHLSLLKLRRLQAKCLALRNKRISALKGFVRENGPVGIPTGNMTTWAWVAGHAEADARLAICMRVGLEHPAFCSCKPFTFDEILNLSEEVLLAPCKNVGGICPDRV